MKKVVDLTGQRFGKLTVIKRVENYVSPKGHTEVRWLCKCDCGNEVVKHSSNLKQGNTVSCGCFKKICRRTHGMTNTRFYSIWNKMKQRCISEVNKDYKNYGGRGIKVCDIWLIFEKFRDDMYESYLKHIEEFGEKNTTLDRIDVNSNYNKKNCKWSTNKEQANNKTNNHYITFNNKTKTLSQWADELKINASIINDRINRYKWSIEKALCTPLKNQRR